MVSPERGEQILMGAMVSLLETGALFFFCDQDGHTPRGGSAHAKQSGSTCHRSSD
jgi:hypothetical protein